MGSMLAYGFGAREYIVGCHWNKNSNVHEMRIRYYILRIKFTILIRIMLWYWTEDSSDKAVGPRMMMVVLVVGIVQGNWTIAYVVIDSWFGGDE